MSLSSKTIQRYVRKLKDSGRLRRIGSGRGGYWEVE
jgi:predicted HTH transcriptional regulator